MSAVTFRPVDMDRDLAALVTLLQATQEERGARQQITEAILQDYERTRLPDTITCRLAACGADGSLLGAGEAERRSYHPEGQYRMTILVMPDSRNRGIGTALEAALMDFIRGQGATRLTAEVRENCPAGLRFAQQRGFAVERHTFSSTLDIPQFDLHRFAGTVEKLQAEGLRFFSFADTDRGPEAQRKLYDLNTLAGLDVPGSDADGVRPFEQFARDVFDAYWFRPEGQIFAAEGDTWVGMAAVGEVNPGVMVNMFTGVRREYRGRHIALALKLLVIAFCQKHGAAQLRTGNDSTNQPMLAINRKLGYRPDPGLYHMARALTLPSHHA